MGRTNGLFCDGETARTVDEGEIEGETEPEWGCRGDNRGRDGDALLLEDLLLECAEATCKESIARLSLVAAAR